MTADAESLWSEIALLVEAQLYDRATPDDAARLEQLLRDDPRARQFYFQYLDDCVKLSSYFAGRDATSAALRAATAAAVPPAVAPPAAAAPPAPSRPDDPPSAVDPPKTTLFSIFLPNERWLDAMPVVMFAVLMLSIGVFVGWRVGTRQNAEPAAPAGPLARSPDRAAPPAGEEKQVSPVPLPAHAATLVAAVNCEWIEAPADFRPGVAVAEGTELRLASGVAELMFRSGVRVTLEGPAVLSAISAGGGAIESGNLAAEVPPDAVGFAVRTPAATVIDLGTSFGVTVEPARVTEVHVIEGRVAIESIRSARRHIIEQGHAWRLPSRDPQSWVEIGAAPERFYRTATARFAPAVAQAGAPKPVDPNPQPPVPAASLPPIDGADRWTILAADTFDGPRLDGSLWETLAGPPDIAGRHKPSVASKKGVLELVNCGVLLSKSNYAATAEQPVRVTAEWQAGKRSDGPTIALDVAPIDNPTPNQWVTHVIQCTYNLKNPHTNHSSLVIAFGYPGQEQTELNFADCEAAEPGGRYRLDVVRYARRVTFQVTYLDGEGWTRTATAAIPAAFTPAAQRRVALLNFVLAPQEDLVCHVEGVRISTLGK